MEARGRIVHEGIRPGNGVVEEAVLAGGGVSEIAHREATIVDPEDLREHECGARFPWDRGDCWVGDCGRDDGAWHYRRVGRETVYLAVVAEIEAHHQAVVVDSLGVDDVRRNPHRLVDHGEAGAVETVEDESWGIGPRGKLADDVTVVIDPEGIDGVRRRREVLQRAAVGEEEGVRAIAADDVAMAADPVRVGARGGAGQRREVEVGERVTTRGDWTTNKRSPGAARGRQQTHQG